MESLSKTKKVIIYHHTATQHQNDNTSLAMQEKVCRAFCAEHGLTVLDVITEVASSAVWREQSRSWQCEHDI